jgi:uncharacterized protein
MAVRTSTASDSDRTGPLDQRQRPIRTCIGCRQRAVATELLRVVVAPDAVGSAQPIPVVPDPRQRAPGRGAWLHQDLECVELAERRRAFARALRASGSVDPTPVREYIAAATRSSEPAEPRRSE